MPEVSNMNSAAMQIKVAQGKGNKDRFTMLPTFIPEDLPTFFRQARIQLK